MNRDRVTVGRVHRDTHEKRKIKVKKREIASDGRNTGKSDFENFQMVESVLIWNQKRKFHYAEQKFFELQKNKKIDNPRPNGLKLWFEKG